MTLLSILDKNHYLKAVHHVRVYSLYYLGRANPNFAEEIERAEMGLASNLLCLDYYTSHSKNQQFLGDFFLLLKSNLYRLISFSLKIWKTRIKTISH